MLPSQTRYDHRKQLEHSIARSRKIIIFTGILAIAMGLGLFAVLAYLLLKSI